LPAPSADSQPPAIFAAGPRIATDFAQGALSDAGNDAGAKWAAVPAATSTPVSVDIVVTLIFVAPEQSGAPSSWLAPLPSVGQDAGPPISFPPAGKGSGTVPGSSVSPPVKTLESDPDKEQINDGGIPDTAVEKVSSSSLTRAPSSALAVDPALAEAKPAAAPSGVAGADQTIRVTTDPLAAAVLAGVSALPAEAPRPAVAAGPGPFGGAKVPLRGVDIVATPAPVSTVARSEAMSEAVPAEGAGGDLTPAATDPAQLPIAERGGAPSLAGLQMPTHGWAVSAPFLALRQTLASADSWGPGLANAFRSLLSSPWLAVTAAGLVALELSRRWARRVARWRHAAVEVPGLTAPSDLVQ